MNPSIVALWSLLILRSIEVHHNHMESALWYSVLIVVLIIYEAFRLYRDFKKWKAKR